MAYADKERQSEYHKRYFQINKMQIAFNRKYNPRVKEYDYQYYRHNKEKILLRSKQRYEKIVELNPNYIKEMNGKQKENHRKYYQEHKERLKKYFHDNRDKINRTRRNRYLRKNIFRWGKDK